MKMIILGSLTASLAIVLMSSRLGEDREAAKADNKQSLTNNQQAISKQSSFGSIVNRPSFKVKEFLTIMAIRHWIAIGLSVSLAGSLGGCTSSNVPIGSTSLNSRATEQQPALSANGRFLAFISNRNGSHDVWLYDLQQRQFIELPRLNRRQAIARSPSVSNTARYISYLISDQGRPAVVVYDRLIRKSRIIYEAYQGSIRHPRISPDGRYVVFENGLRGHWDIAVIDRGPNIELDLLDGVPLGPSLTQ